MVDMRSVVFALCVGIILVPSLAAGEPYAGIYLGGSFAQDGDAETEIQGFKFDSDDLEYDGSFLFGAKFGIFYDKLIFGGHFGIELDINYFHPDPEDLDFDLRIIPLGVNLLYRYPIKYFDPYAGIGIAAFWGTLDSDDFEDDDDVAGGFQVLAGIKAFFTKNIAMFTEYKYFHTGDFEFNSSVGRIKQDINGHQLYGGIAYHW